jgi:hypothetical protein
MQKIYDSVQWWAVVKAVVEFCVPKEEKSMDFYQLSNYQLIQKEGFSMDFEV